MGHYSDEYNLTI